jgi:hypothetical protein
MIFRSWNQSKKLNQSKLTNPWNLMQYHVFYEIKTNLAKLVITNPSNISYLDILV